MFGEVRSVSPKVFISSTVKDLRDLRSALAWTLGKQGFTVLASESPEFPVRGDRSAPDECFASISQCDYYILMIGSRTGILRQDGVSITRHEYRLARESFLKSGRPKLHLYLRSETQSALKSRDNEAIDNIDHLSSFIDEIQQSDAPSFLQRFVGFRELMESLSVRLNLGRDLSERLMRQSLLSELLRNLSLMSVRTELNRVPAPYHRYLANLRKKIDLKPEMIGQTTLLSDIQVISLVFAFVRGFDARDLRTEAIKQVLGQGIFLVFDPAMGTLTESPEHIMLRQTCEDIERLCRLDRPAEVNETPWDRNLLALVKRQWKSPNPLGVPSTDLILAFGYYDRMENIFNAHVSMCRVLLGRSPHIETFARSPETPLGSEMEQGLRQERVPPALVRWLIDNDIYPFGKRVSSGTLEGTREEQLDSLMRFMKNDPDLPSLGEMDDALLRKVAENVLDNDIVPYDGEPEQPTG